MSTKNLARTAIEGGRCGHYKSEVRDLARSERAANREYIGLVKRDVEAADDLPLPKRGPSFPCFDDKLSPVRRFLESRVGKSWNKTLTMILERFDTRTTPGRHVVHDHMLKDIAPSKAAMEAGAHYFFNRYRYFIDAQGVLRKAPERKREKAKVEPFDTRALVSWLGNRKVGKMGDRFVWFHPTRDGDSIQAKWTREGLSYIMIDENGEPVLVQVPYRTWWQPEFDNQRAAVPYRQGRLLNAEDEKFFRSLPEHGRVAVLKAAPANAGPDGPSATW